MDAKEVLYNKVTQPRWFSCDPEHSSYEAWSYGHPVAPWELELTAGEWDSLAGQRDYFYTIQQGRNIDLPKRLCSTDGTESLDSFQYNLAVPLYSNLDALGGVYFLFVA